VEVVVLVSQLFALLLVVLVEVEAVQPLELLETHPQQLQLKDLLEEIWVVVLTLAEAVAVLRL
tara:strand:+ start:314 stop:502 length:189 start_codon:yes stop_codon:yes gene_type:complete